MEIIVISLERALDRRILIKEQLDNLSLDYFILDAIDGEKLSIEEKNKKIHLLNGYRFGEIFKPGEIACTMSHIKAIKIAKENNLNNFIVLEDDVILAKDFLKRINILKKIVPKKWEHIYLSGIPNVEPPASNLVFPSILSSVFTQCTHSMMINSVAYNKIIDKLSLFETTTDDIYCNLIQMNNLISYTYYPFVTYANADYTYIWNTKITTPHPSKKYFKNKI